MTEMKQGIMGILEVDKANGIIYFHADPRRFNGPNVILKITNLPGDVIDFTKCTIEIEAKSTNLLFGDAAGELQPTAAEAAVESSEKDAPSPVAQPLTVHKRPLPQESIQNPEMPAAPIKPGDYADVLYPAVVVDIMRRVIAGGWDGSNPEAAIDGAIAVWFHTNVGDPRRYVADLMRAVRIRNCLDVVIARMNAEILSEPDQGDSIKIMRNRRRLLPHENQEIVDEGDLPHGLTQMDAPTDADGTVSYASKDAYLTTEKLAEEFYADEKIYQLRTPKPSLSPQARSMVRQRLKEQGYILSVDVKEAHDRLEALLHNRDLEQSVLARLCFLATFNALNGVDGFQAIDAIAPQRRLPEISAPKRLFDRPP